MPWEYKTIEKWTVCWKWGFIPYPCKKKRKRWCCSGIRKVRCYVLIGENWFCCGQKESHWWSSCWGVGTTIAQATVCKKKVPDESSGCPNTVGDAPPSGQPMQQSQSYLQASVAVGGGAGGIIGALIGALAIGGTGGTVGGAIAGLVVGAIAGVSTGRRCGCLVTLIALIIVALLLYLLFGR